MRTLLGLALCFFLLTGTLHASGPAGAVAAAWKDASVAVAAGADLTYTRYLALFPSTGETAEELRRVLSVHVNSLSREPDIEIPLVVGGSLLRIDIRNYKWNPKTWEKLANFDPYFHVRVKIAGDTGKVEYREIGKKTIDWPGGVYDFGNGTSQYAPAGKYNVPVYEKVGGVDTTVAAPWLPPKEIVDLVKWTGSQVPIVRADWFFVRSVRQLSLDNKNDTGVGYYDWLEIKNRDDYFRLGRFDEKASKDLGKHIRAAVSESGVATHNRQIARLAGLTGGVWITLDTNNSTGRGDAIRNLKEGDYLHKAEEIYLPLPNKLPAYFLGDEKGVKQDSAPDFIGADKTAVGNDGRIHVGISCWRCHVEVLRPIDDWARAELRDTLKLASPDYKTLKELKSQYLSNLERQVEKDVLEYSDAISDASGGWNGAQNAKAFARVYNRYVEDLVTLEMAAAEIGCTPEHLRKSIETAVATPSETKPAGTIDLRIGALIKPKPRPMGRLQWEERFVLVASYAMGVVP